MRGSEVKCGGENGGKKKGKAFQAYNLYSERLLTPNLRRYRRLVQCGENGDKKKEIRFLAYSLYS